jgi:hypothetical protein
MGGGLMQLVAYGAQDIYLTGNPQITFFKVVYRRHTNFAVESIEQTFNGSAELGKKFSCTISRNGDLLHRVYLEMVTAGEANSGTTQLDGFNLIDYVELEIGGQCIDKHYGQWMGIWVSLTHDADQIALVNKMLEVTGQSDAGTPTTSTIYVPLQFWFCRNPGLALPLIALQYHEVKINVELDSVANICSVSVANLNKDDLDKVNGAQANTVVGSTDVSTNLGLKLNSADLLVNYLYLDTDERRRFAQVSHEYLIEQVQHTGVETAGGPITMNFNHPVKALFWTGKDWTNVKLQLNGHDRAAVQPHDYYHLVQPYESGLGHCGMSCKSLNVESRAWNTVAANGDVGMYSFCLKPAEHQPSGTCNFSRIDNARLNMGGSDDLYLFAMNYNVLRIMSGMGGLAYSN